MKIRVFWNQNIKMTHSFKHLKLQIKKLYRIVKTNDFSIIQDNNFNSKIMFNKIWA